MFCNDSQIFIRQPHVRMHYAQGLAHEHRSAGGIRQLADQLQSIGGFICLRKVRIEPLVAQDAGCEFADHTFDRDLTTPALVEHLRLHALFPFFLRHLIHVFPFHIRIVVLGIGDGRAHHQTQGCTNRKQC